MNDDIFPEVMDGLLRLNSNSEVNEEPESATLDRLTSMPIQNITSTIELRRCQTQPIKQRVDVTVRKWKPFYIRNSCLGLDHVEGVFTRMPSSHYACGETKSYFDEQTNLCPNCYNKMRKAEVKHESPI